MKRRRFLIRLLTLALMLALVSSLTLTARAMETYGLWVGGTEVTADKLSGEGWSYDAAAGTLTLTNYTYTGPGMWFNMGDGRESAGILYRGETPLTIKLAGNNSVTHADTCVASYGIYAEADLTILGDGSLTAAAGKAEVASRGICTGKNAAIAINGCKITATTSAARDYCDGIFAYSGFVLQNGTVETSAIGVSHNTGIYVLQNDCTIKDSTVTATAGAAYETEGIFCNNGAITVENSEVTATAGAAQRMSTGVSAMNGVTVTGSTVTAAGGAVKAAEDQTDVSSIGISSHTDGITINGSKVEASSSAVTGGDGVESAASQGIKAGAPITISGGEVIASGGDVTVGNDGIGYSYAINGVTVTITGGIVTGTAGTGTFSGGILGDETLTVTGGTVKAFGDEGYRSIGLCGNDGVTISGGEITATGGKGETGSNGVRCGRGSIVISGAETKLTAAGGEAAESSAGIHAGKTLTVQSGTVTAFGGTATGDEGESKGIFAEEAITIEGGTVKADAGQSGHNSDAIDTEGDILIRGDETVVTGGGGTGEDNSDGINAKGDITIEGGTVTAVSGRAVKLCGSGLCSEAGNILIRGAKTAVTAVGSESGDCSFGISCWKVLTVQDGTVKAEGRSAPGIYGVITGAADISGGTLTASAGESDQAATSVGLRTYGRVAVTGGTVTANSGAAEEISVGIASMEGQYRLPDGTVVEREGQGPYEVTVSGGTVTAGAGASAFSEGIFVDGAVTISGGTVTASAESYEGEAESVASVGIHATEGMTITGGTVKADGKPATNSFGLYNSEGELAIRGGNVTAFGEKFGISTGDEGTLTVDKTNLTSFLTGENADSAKASDPADYPANPTKYVSITYQTPSSGGGGGGGGGTTNPVTVPASSAVTGGTVQVSASNAKAGEKVTITPQPDEGYVTAGVTVTDKNGKEVPVTKNADGTYSFTMPATAVTITPVFEKAGDAGGTETPVSGDVSDRFTDVSKTAWYHDAVQWAVDNGVMNGVKADKFAPNDATTRAMVVTMLWRMAGEPVVNYYMPYTDVPQGAWYAEAVRWAASAGAVNGTGETTFSPNEPVTREQLAAILYRYAQAQGFEGAWMFLLDFPDADQVSDWANEAMHWMVMHGVITGMSDGTLAPQANATRAQIATMFMRFAEEMAK